MTTDLITYQEVKDLSLAVAKSALFKGFQSPDQAIVLMMLAQSEGIHPMQAMATYDVIQGKPALKTTALMSRFQSRGGVVKYITMTDTECEAEFTCAGIAEPIRIKWTIEMARKAGLTNKDPWKFYARAMLRSRVVAEGVRAAMPSVLGGLYTVEEVEGFTDNKPINITPTKHADAIAAACAVHAPEPVATPAQEAVIIEAEVVPPPKPVDPEPEIKKEEPKERKEQASLLENIKDTGNRNEIIALIQLHAADKKMTKSEIKAAIKAQWIDSQGIEGVFLESLKGRFMVGAK